MKRTLLMDAAQADLRLTRLAYEIYENHTEASHLVLAGIEERGMDLAQVLKKKLQKICPLTIEIISVSINKKNPVEVECKQAGQVAQHPVILIDDVANSGRTLLYAMSPFLHQVQSSIQVAVLVDRRHKSFPVSCDYIGMQLSTTIQDHIVVEMEKGKVSGAYLE